MSVTRSLLVVIGSISLLAVCGHSAPEKTSSTPTPTFATAFATAEDGRS